MTSQLIHPRALSKALAIDQPVLDEPSMRAGVHAAWDRRRNRIAVGGCLGVLAVAGFLFLATHQRSLTTGSARVHASSNVAARTPAPAARPVFALLAARSPQHTARAIIDEIARLRAELARTKTDDPARAQLLFRLGEAYDDQRQTAEPGCDSRATAASAALQSWHAVFDDSRYREYQHRDQALFDAGFLLFQEHQEAQAQPLFQKILDEHSSSPLAPNAAVARAEPAFEAGDMKTALRFYNRALNPPNSVMFGYALYKVGWAHYNLHEIDQAAAAFQKVVDLGEQGKLHAGSHPEILVAECKKALEHIQEIRRTKDQ
jgi:tetratricopeptide (TPR) repeat protein